MMKLTLDDKIKVRNALWDNEDLILAFIEENPFGLVDEELCIVGSWQHNVPAFHFQWSPKNQAMRKC
jgi:hypothetical protein